MRRSTAIAGAVSVLLMLAACGGGDDKVADAGAGGSTGGSTAGTPAGTPGGTPGGTPAGTPGVTPAAADAPASSPAAPSAPDAAERVSPRAGMKNVHPVHFESAQVVDQRTVRVTFYGGVEPCDVLDSVKVAYHPHDVTVSLFSGSDPAKPDAVCIDIAKLKVTDVHLTEDVGDREIKDGAPAAHTTSGTTAPAAGKLPGDAAAAAVTPQPGQADVHAISWNRYETVGPATVRIYFVSGVAPCSVLDHVTVRYAQEVIRIALFSGSDPARQGQACPMLARTVYTDVALSEPLGKRDVVDDTTTD